MQSVKWVLLSFLGVAGAIVLCALGITIFMATAGADTHRWMAKNLLEIVLDRKAHIDGIASLDLGLHPSFIASDIWLENPSWAEKKEMAKLDRVEMRLELLPLFSGNVLIPWLKIDGLKIEFEKNVDGKTNWMAADINAKASQAGRPKYSYVPLLELISLNDLTLTFRDRTNGRTTEVIVENLVQRRRADDESLTIKGNGRVDNNVLSISGQFGSIEAALAATQPYPIDLSVDARGLSVRLAGTVGDLSRGAGFDLDLAASAPSVERFFDLWGVAPPMGGRAELSARFKGNLETLSVEDILLKVIESTGHQITATGSVADISKGQGLDIRFSGRMSGKNEFWRQLSGGLQASDGIALAGRIGGNFSAPLFEDIRLRAAHRSGADLSATTSVALDLSTGATEVTALRVSAEATLPDGRLLKKIFKRDIKDPGPMTASLQLSLADGGFFIDKFNIRARSFGGFSLEATGPLGGRSSNGFNVLLDPQIDLTVRMGNSTPLLTLFDNSLRRLGPFIASARIAANAGQYRLDKMRLALGTKDSLWAKAEGSVGSIRPAHNMATEKISVAVRFGWPTSSTLARVLRRDLPELGEAKGQLVLTGSPNRLRIRAARLETRRSDGVTVIATGKVGALSLSPKIAATRLDFDLTAHSETTAAIAGIVGKNLKELGPMRARAHLTDRGDRYRLNDIIATAGPPRNPLIRIAGQVANVEQLTGINLTGNFDIETPRLLDLIPIGNQSALGALVGTFVLSDTDGSLGIEALNAEVRKTKLFSLSVTGRLDDLRRLDEMKFQTVFDAPTFSKLARALGLEADNVASVNFRGLASGSDERFSLEGDLRVGKTVVSAMLAGTVVGKRPSIKGRIHSPHLRLADFGIAPERETASRNKPKSPPRQPAKRIFGNEPISFKMLQGIDLDVGFGFDEYEGSTIAIDNIFGQLRLNNGILKLDPVNFRFFKGGAKMTGLIDAQNKVPTFRLKYTADDVDLGQALGHTGGDVPLAGEIGMNFDLTAEGGTPRAIASSLNGTLKLAVKRGRIRAGLFSLTPLDTYSPFPGKSDIRTSIVSLAGLAPKTALSGPKPSCWIRPKSM